VGPGPSGPNQRVRDPPPHPLVRPLRNLTLSSTALPCALPLKLGPGSDLRRSLEGLAIEQNAAGFVLGVVGNLSQAAFQCPGRAEPSLLQGDLEIITLNGTVSPQGVHLHLSLSDGDCQVWGGHLEHGTLVLKGADLLVGFLTEAGPPPVEASGGHSRSWIPKELPAGRGPQLEYGAGPRVEHLTMQEPRVAIAVLPGCPFSARALRMLRTLGIPHRVQQVETDAERQDLEQRSGRRTLPQVFIDGQCIGGYDALAELHGRGDLALLR
jgi:glutaredoxin/predicted DNA-binding protein with PD1-like motif